jgi:hypothetical protein
MYKKEIELTRVKAAELAKLDLDEERDLRNRLEKNADDFPVRVPFLQSPSKEGHLTEQDDVLIA